MFERFTKPAQKVMALANREAGRFGHEYIGTYHILLGLIRCDTGIGLMILKNLHVDLEHLRGQIDVLLPKSPRTVTPQTRPRPGAKEVLIQAMREADSRQHRLVDTAHILLGLAHQDTGATGRLLRELGITPEAIAEEVLRLSQTGMADEPPPAPRKWPFLRPGT